MTSRLASLQSDLAKARKHHRPRSHIERELRQLRHEQVMREQLTFRQRVRHWIKWRFS